MFIRNLLNSHSSWLVSTLIISILTTPLLAINHNLKSGLLENFNRLEINSREAREALVDGYQLLEILIQDINSKYNYSLTLKDAGLIVKSNLHQFRLPSEAKASLLVLIEFIELVNCKISEDQSFIEMSASYIQLGFLPAFFKSFRLDKKSLQRKSRAAVLAIPFPFPEQTEGELPTGLIVGSVEIFAGALFCIIPHTITWGIGSTLITDGISRIFDDLSKKHNTEAPRTSLSSDD